MEGAQIVCSLFIRSKHGFSENRLRRAERIEGILSNDAATNFGRVLSKSVVLLNLIQALCAVILGNIAYFLLAASFHLPRHRPFHFDAGMIVDFWFCLVAYGLIRTARRWK